jgi:putative acetyltransferase
MDFSARVADNRAAFSPGKENRQMSEASIRPFRPGDAVAFKALNLAWIARNFRVEPMDLRLLDHPKHILETGGFIFIAEKAGEAIGTPALLPLCQGEMKLEKMAVVEAARGQGAGAALLRAAIDHGHSIGLAKLALETSNALAPSVALHEKFGFRHLAPEQREASPCQRAEVSKELVL